MVVLEETGCYGVGGQAGEAHVVRNCRQPIGADGGHQQETEVRGPEATWKYILPITRRNLGEDLSPVCSLMRPQPHQHLHCGLVRP